MKRKKLIQGKHFHGWAWKHKRVDESDTIGTCLFHWAEPSKPKMAKLDQPTENGKWVRVRFIEVKS